MKIAFLKEAVFAGVGFAVILLFLVTMLDAALTTPSQKAHAAAACGTVSMYTHTDGRTTEVEIDFSVSVADATASGTWSNNQTQYAGSWLASDERQHLLQIYSNDIDTGLGPLSFGGTVNWSPDGSTNCSAYVQANALVSYSYFPSEKAPCSAASLATKSIPSLEKLASCIR